jgi:hypothetical protein
MMNCVMKLYRQTTIMDKRNLENRYTNAIKICLQRPERFKKILARILLKSFDTIQAIEEEL